jgi:hypothetical protein
VDQTVQAGGIRGIYADEGSSAWTIEKNLIENTGTDGLFIHLGNRMIVENNIFTGLDDSVGRGLLTIKYSGTKSYKDGTGGKGSPTDPTGHTVRYNIFHDDTHATSKYRVTSTNEVTVTGYSSLGTLDYNLFATDVCSKQYDSGTTVITLAQVVSTFGIEANSVAGDPLFADVAAGDFTVVGSSPAIELGFVNFQVPYGVGGMAE